MSGVIAWFARNPVAANLLMLVLMVGGAIAVPTIKQEIFPEFSADIVTVSVIYPGASPDEVEESICVRIEEQVDGVDGIDEVTSSATEGAGAVTIQVLPGTDPRRVLEDVKARVDAIDTFPGDAEKPVIQEVTLRKQVLFVAVSGDAEERSLHRIAERVRDELSALPEVGQAELAAVREFEISIELSEEALQRHGLTFAEVAELVRRSALDVPGGAVKTEAGEVLLRARGRAYHGPEFANLVLWTRPDGTRLRLGDVARVVDGYADSDQWSRFDGKPTVLIAVYRTGDQSALGVGRAARDHLAAARGSLPDGVALTVWQDESRFLKERLDTLLRNGRSGLLLVFLVLALFLRLRLAFWVSLGIPISFLGTLMLMPSLDASINMLSLFAFILVLGIVVDDAIVVGENIYRKQREGLRGLEAAVQGAREVAVPVVFAVLTTVVAFLPMLNLPGLTGRIWRIIPLVVIPCLLFSLVESKLILPAHLVHSGEHEGPPRRGWIGLWDRLQERFARGLESAVARWYRPLVQRALEWRWLTASIAVSLLALTGGLIGSGHVKMVFFPAVEGDNVVALLTMPLGTPAEVTARAVADIEASAVDLVAELEAETNDGTPVPVQHMLTSVGRQPYRVDQSRNQGFVAKSFSGSHLGEINLQLAASEEREVSAAEITRRWRERTGPVADAVELVFTSSLFSAGKPVDVQLAGSDPEQLTAAAEELKRELARFPGVYDVSDSFRAGKREIALTLLPQGEALGLTAADLGRQVRAAFHGEEAQRIQRGRDEVKVMVRYPAERRRSLADLTDMRIRTRDGGEVPLREVARVEHGRGYATIQRSDRRRTLNVTAEVDTTLANANEILDALALSTLPDLRARFRGVSWSYEGEREEQQKTLASLGRGFLLALLGIYALMAIPFRSYVQPLVVMLAVPFGAVGAVLGHLLLGMDLSILSMVGLVALAGVVVNDSLVLVDRANRLRDAGAPLFEAVREAGIARFRAILLTSLTTFAGLLPMILETSVQAAFLIPMAVSLAFGVVFSTAISLLLVPAATLMLEDVLDLGRRLVGRPARASGAPTS